MDTKANPDPNDCWHRALNDEPRWTLLGRDAAAPATLRFWREERMRLLGNATDQENDVLATAGEFEDWRAKNEGRWHDEEPDMVTEPEAPAKSAKAPTPTDALSSLAGKVTGGHQPTLAEAKKLAAFVLNADPRKGPNKA